MTNFDKFQGLRGLRCHFDGEASGQRSDGEERAFAYCIPAIERVSHSLVVLGRVFHCAPDIGIATGTHTALG